MRPIAPDIADAIRSAPYDEADAALAARLGVGVNTVRRYRAQVREARKQHTQDAIAEHAEAHITDALADLVELRAAARAQYLGSPDDPGKHDPRDGQLWLAAIREELGAVGAEPDVTRRARATEADLIAGIADVLDAARERAARG